MFYFLFQLQTTYFFPCAEGFFELLACLNVSACKPREMLAKLNSYMCVDPFYFVPLLSLRLTLFSIFSYDA
jgi:hypothetical protein